ncbi:hypothetical protein, conserved [Trypanosoma brucei gambiense DAL972]|uniref:Uncharacterized protein n=2 Tax=Trypanosoma brucei TaxID=5691 RepID=C9ZZK2_TRYB9|nr:hypothetical protein, conserved [Trypanosoma brucei gambiense DAL972]RHW66966.1 hypothetical protein DPX39_000067500 [Trypanosoma brucei equiperdum]CBH14851.1 hypothetical protein, conserved [Trypanosoma brucei gambiense DAL972]|eukprot:XP_011777117.1 hypothetical protein, conserved [Trypanosoma brucei gambiense DAL972]
MRRTAFSLMIVPPESHRYAKATFHEGVHRQAPGDSTPWRDVASPLNRFKMWWLAPAAKGTMTAAWCMTIVMGAYCFSIQQDAKGTYLLNNVLLRTLHEEAMRADANQERANELQEYLKQRLEKLEAGGKAASRNMGGDAVKEGLINHELEISRERVRSDTIHQRNQQLVDELLKVRQELAVTRKKHSAALSEIDKLQKLLKACT